MAMARQHAPGFKPKAMPTSMPKPMPKRMPKVLSRSRAAAPPPGPWAPDALPCVILGVSSLASATQLTSAYRGLARHWHPDKPTGDDATFKRVGEAYAQLMKRSCILSSTDSDAVDDIQRQCQRTEDNQRVAAAMRRMQEEDEAEEERKAAEKCLVAEAAEAVRLAKAEAVTPAAEKLLAAEASEAADADGCAKQPAAIRAPEVLQACY